MHASNVTQSYTDTSSRRKYQCQVEKILESLQIIYRYHVSMFKESYVKFQHNRPSPSEVYDIYRKIDTRVIPPRDYTISVITFDTQNVFHSSQDH